jgi:ribosome-associated protein
MEETKENIILLQQFLKLKNAVGSGGEAKLLIQHGEVMVNGKVETRRGKKLHPGDTVTVQGKTYTV